MTTSFTLTRTEPNAWPRLRQLGSSAHVGLKLSAPREPGELNAEGAARLGADLLGGVRRSLGSAAESWVVEVYVSLLKVEKPGRTQAYLLRRDKVWRRLESWGEAVPEGERVEIDLADQEDAIHLAGAIRAPIAELPRAAALTLFGSEDATAVVTPHAVEPLESRLRDMVVRRQEFGSFFVAALSNWGPHFVLLGGESDDHRQVELDVVSSEVATIEALAPTLGS